MPAVEDGAADRYLGQFMPANAATVVNQASPGAQYLPSARIAFADDDGGWVLWRVVEKSAQDENGVFVNTQTHIRSTDPDAFETQAELFTRLDRLADRIAGLQREETW